MPFIVDNQPQIVHYAQFCTHQEPQRHHCGGVYDSGSVQLVEISVGGTVYQLRTKLTGKYYRALNRLHVPSLSPTFVGEGASEREAIDDLNLKVHAAFQRLFHMRPFEMSNEDKSTWTLIGDVIDVTLFRNRTPILVRQFGEVMYQKRSYPTAILWDGGFREEIQISQVACDDFITYLPGQPIEAITERDPLTRELLSIRFIQRVSGLRSEREIAQDDLVESIGTSADLPVAEWD